MIKHIKYLIPLIGEVINLKVYDKSGRVNVKRTMMRRSIIYFIILLSFGLNIVLVKRMLAIAPMVGNYESHSKEIEVLKQRVNECELKSQILTNALNNTLGEIKYDLSSIKPKDYTPSEPVKVINPKESIDSMSKDTGNDNQTKDGAVH